MGGSSDLCAWLQPGEPVILMGPTGTPTETPAGETVLLAGGGLGNAVLFSIGRALRAAGSKVLYFAGYKKLQDRYKVAEIEAAADVVVWTCDEAPGFTPSRPQDKTHVGNIVAGHPELCRRASWARRSIKIAGCRPHHRHRLRRHDGGGGAGAARRAEAVSEAAASRDRLASTRRCNA